MSIFPRLARWIELICTGLMWVGQLVIFAMFPLITADVFMRYVFNAPISGVFEVVQLMNVIAMTMTVAYVQVVKRHVWVNIIFNRFPLRLQFSLEVVIYLLALAFFGMLTWRMGVWSLESWTIRESTQGLITFPMYPVKMLLTFGCGTMSLMLVIDIVRSFSNLLRPPVGYKRAEAEF